MTLFQQLAVASVSIISIFLFIYSYQKCFHKHNSFGLTFWLYPLGMFVWGDVLILSLFWFLVSAISIYLQDWLLFLLFIAIFWAIRSLGEMIYWLLEQFGPVKRNNPENLFGHSIVRNESIFFVYQVFWQCCLVFSLIISLYLAHLWLISL